MTAFLEADGNPRPEHAPIKSPSAFSRFLNHYDWNASCSQDSTCLDPTPAPSGFGRCRAVRARAIIRTIRTAVTAKIWSLYAQRKGRRPILEIMVDLTTLEKTGKFPNLEIHLLLVRQHLTGYSRQLKDKIGLHLIVLYVILGVQRFPWAFAIWRGKDTASPAKLALHLLACIPAFWSERFTVRVLADSGFDSDEFIERPCPLGASYGQEWRERLGFARCDWQSREPPDRTW